VFSPTPIKLSAQFVHTCIHTYDHVVHGQNLHNIDCKVHRCWQVGSVLWLGCLHPHIIRMDIESNCPKRKEENKSGSDTYLWTTQVGERTILLRYCRLLGQIFAQHNGWFIYIYIYIYLLLKMRERYYCINNFKFQEISLLPQSNLTHGLPFSHWCPNAHVKCPKMNFQNQVLWRNFACALKLNPEAFPKLSLSPTPIFFFRELNPTLYPFVLEEKK
jgi:hypothetical protein